MKEFNSKQDLHGEEGLYFCTKVTLDSNNES